VKVSVRSGRFDSEHRRRLYLLEFFLGISEVLKINSGTLFEVEWRTLRALASCQQHKQADDYKPGGF
jgi:hypothetical protein